MITDFTNMTSQISKFSLDVLSMQHNYISNNIANVNTQNFHPSKIDFSSIYESIEVQLDESTDLKSVLSDARSELHQEQHVIKSEVASVELDSELIGLSKNTIMYKSILSALSSRGDFMKIVLNAGR